MNAAPIGIFDSGYGGLTVLKEIKKHLPQYDFIYLGDNARTPYGTRSYETVYQFTRECVEWLFTQNCPLIILACNTASAKALRTIQQKDLVQRKDGNNVLGVIRPTAEVAGNYTKTKHIGVLGTSGTVKSESYLIEIQHFFPEVTIFQQACPLWVPLIENNEHLSEGAEYFIKKDIAALLKQSRDIDTVLLGCTHYPLLKETIERLLPKGITIISQGEIVAKSLGDYLNRHPEMGARCSKNAVMKFYTTDSTEDFDKHSINFYGEIVHSVHVDL